MIKTSLIEKEDYIQYNKVDTTPHIDNNIDLEW